MLELKYFWKWCSFGTEILFISLGLKNNCFVDVTTFSESCSDPEMAFRCATALQFLIFIALGQIEEFIHYSLQLPNPRWSEKWIKCWTLIKIELPGITAAAFRMVNLMTDYIWFFCVRQSMLMFKLKYKGVYVFSAPIHEKWVKRV